MKVIMPVYSISPEFIGLTENAINSLAGNEFYIIDNASTHGGGQLREWASVYVRNKENVGYGKAVNQGLKLCDFGEIVAVANNDIRVSEGWEQAAKEILDEDPMVMAVHFKMIPYDQPFTKGNTVWIKGKERWCTGSFFVMRNVGRFDENFFNSYDDWDIHLRMYQRGYKTAYTNKASYQHLDSSTQKIIPDREERDKRNRAYFIEKHGDAPENIFMKLFPEQMTQDYRGGFV